MGKGGGRNCCDWHKDLPYCIVDKYLIVSYWTLCCKTLLENIAKSSLVKGSAHGHQIGTPCHVYMGGRGA